MSLSEDHAIETYKSMIEIGRDGLRALQWVNGGAVVALLAYLGQVDNRAVAAAALSPALACFVVGLIVATLTVLTVYLTQYSLWNEAMGRTGIRWTTHGAWLLLSLCLALGSLISFGSGTWHAIDAFVGH